MIKIRRSQSLLEFVLAFSIIGFLAIGTIRLAIWFNANFAKRQIAYERDRLTSGQGNYTTGNYTPEQFRLTDDFLFRGKVSDQEKVNKVDTDKPECIDVENFCLQKSVTDNRQLFFTIADDLRALASDVRGYINMIQPTVCQTIEWYAWCQWIIPILNDFADELDRVAEEFECSATAFTNCPSNAKECF